MDVKAAGAALIDRLRRHWVLLVYLGSVVLVTFQFGGRGAANNIKIFRWSFYHLLRGQDLYQRYPSVYYDVFKYSPTWALLFGPFALAPAAVGFLAWDLGAVLLLYHAMHRLLPGPQARLALAIAFFDVLYAMQHASNTNTVVVGLMVVAFVALEEDRQGLAAACIAIGTLMKLYPLATLSVGLLHRRPVRLGMFMAGALAALIALPLVVTSPATLLAQWRSWGRVLSVDTLQRNQSVMGLLQAWFGLGWPNWPVQLTGVALTLAPLGLRRERWTEDGFRRLFLCSLLLFSFLFNHQAEPASSVVGFAGIALWYALSPHTVPRSILMALAFVLGPVLRSGLVPWPIRRTVLPPLQLTTIACLVIWVVVQTQLLSRGRMDDAAPEGAGTATAGPPGDGHR